MCPCPSFPRAQTSQPVTMGWPLMERRFKALVLQARSSTHGPGLCRPGWLARHPAVRPGGLAVASGPHPPVCIKGLFLVSLFLSL